MRAWQCYRKFDRLTDPRLGLLRSKVGLMRAAFVYRPESWPDNKKRAPFHARLLHLMLRWTRKTWSGTTRGLVWLAAEGFRY